MTTINVASDFTPFPAGRFRSIGKGSGEEFRERFLVPALTKGEPTVVILDGTSGYPPSFLEEAFGGLVREGYSAEEIRRTFRLEAGPAFSTYVTLINNFVDVADQRRRQK
jgi:hypothetical protein